MKKLSYLLLILLIPQIVGAEHLGLDQLLREVKKSQGVEAKINRAREAQFLAEKHKQQQLLQAAQAELSKQEVLSSQLKTHLDTNESELSELETELKNRSGVLGELFGVAKQAAGDLNADLRHSLVSAQFPDRAEKLNLISGSKSLPTIEQLETLWYTLQHEMTESGKVVHFNTKIQVAGELKEAKVTRIGTFNVLSNGEYLEFLPDTKRLNLLDRQPDSEYLSLADEIGSAKKGPVEVGIDPTRGVILGMLIKAPNALERIKQGGVIGYIILILGAIGFIYAIFRWVQLTFIGKKMDAQVDSSTVLTDNPLGRVFNAAEQGKISQYRKPGINS